MIERHTFVDMMEDLKDYSDKVRELETTLDCVFENWLAQHEGNTIFHLSRAFFNTNDIRDIDHECNKDDIVEQQQEHVEDLILYYCYTGEFGSKKDKLVNVYERGSIKMNAKTTTELYDIIIDYLENIDEDVVFHL